MTPLATKVKKNITVENLNQLAWARGYRGVAGLARHLNRHRVTLWKAARQPDQHGPTFNLICEALNDLGN
jgi:hypothetical protein